MIGSCQWTKLSRAIAGGAAAREQLLKGKMTFADS